MKTLYLIRGIPGSGKSTLAGALVEGLRLTTGHSPRCFEADTFFIQANGGYKWDATKIIEAHKDCQLRCRRSMELKIPAVIVSNTFTQEWQLLPYRLMAKEFKYDVQEIVCLGEFESIHGVSRGERMKMRHKLYVDLIDRFHEAEVNR
jgi:tRNA uridine 5-carbamoylmethylation protein Kti12